MTNMADPHAAPAGAGHQPDDVSVRGIFGFGVGFLVAAVVISGLVWLLFVYLSDREASHAAPVFPLAVDQEQRLPPEPRLQTNPRQDLLDLRAQEDHVLTTYGWVDKNAGIVRIPIDEAMKLAVTRGLPARPSGRSQ
jgi:hypothetical protein